MSSEAHLQTAFNIIAETASGKWKQIATKLGATTNEITVIEKQNPLDVPQQCQTALNDWVQAVDKEATVERLCDLLSELKLNKLVRQIQEKCGEVRQPVLESKIKVKTLFSAAALEYIKYHIKEFCTEAFISKDPTFIKEAAFNRFNCIVTKQEEGCIQHTLMVFSARDLPNLKKANDNGKLQQYITEAFITDELVEKAKEFVRQALESYKGELLVQTHIDEKEYQSVHGYLSRRERKVRHLGRSQSENDLHVSHLWYKSHKLDFIQLRRTCSLEDVSQLVMILANSQPLNFPKTKKAICTKSGHEEEIEDKLKINSGMLQQAEVSVQVLQNTNKELENKLSRHASMYSDLSVSSSKKAEVISKLSEETALKQGVIQKLTEKINILENKQPAAEQLADKADKGGPTATAEDIKHIVSELDVMFSTVTLSDEDRVHLRADFDKKRRLFLIDDSGIIPKMMVDEVERHVVFPMIKLQIQYHIYNGLPFNFFERCSVILHRQIHLHGDRREDCDGFVKVRQNRVDIYLQSRKAENGRCEYVLLTLIANKTEIKEMLRIQFLFNVNILEYINDNCPGMAFNVNIACPHCMILGEETPYMFYSSRDKDIQCPPDLVTHHHSDVPSAFIYRIPDFEDKMYGKHIDELEQFLERHSSQNTPEILHPLEVHRVNLVEEIDLNSGLYDHLRSMGVITQEVQAEFENGASEVTQKRRLLDYLQNRPKDDLLKFCEALRNTNQQYIVDEYLHSVSQQNEAKSPRRNLPPIDN